MPWGIGRSAGYGRYRTERKLYKIPGPEDRPARVRLRSFSPCPNDLSRSRRLGFPCRGSDHDRVEHAYGYGFGPGWAHIHIGYLHRRTLDIPRWRDAQI